jgi:hypothetical protein
MFSIPWRKCWNCTSIKPWVPSDPYKFIVCILYSSIQSAIFKACTVTHKKAQCMCFVIKRAGYTDWSSLCFIGKHSIVGKYATTTSYIPPRSPFAAVQHLILCNEVLYKHEQRFQCLYKLIQYSNLIKKRWGMCWSGTLCFLTVMLCFTRRYLRKVVSQYLHRENQEWSRLIVCLKHINYVECVDMEVGEIWEIMFKIWGAHYEVSVFRNVTHRIVW